LSATRASAFDRLLAEVRACRTCIDAPTGKPLPHEPRPVVRAQRSAVIAVCGQAPGTRVHASGLPFDDPSGVRLRAWMDVTSEQFYDDRHVAFLPMGFCFPGLDAQGGDLPPRRECALRWRSKLIADLPDLQLMLLVGQYAQRWHLSERFGKPWRSNLSQTVAAWRELIDDERQPSMIPLPHPSWRNNTWLKANPWFEAELVPFLRTHVAKVLTSAHS
jgi:uracil-DNA glycosylase